MPLWDKSGTKPKYLNTEEKRKVIATNLGWVRRDTYTDNHGNARQKDEILVHMGGLDTLVTMALPDISSISIVGATADGRIANGVATQVRVVYDEAVAWRTGVADVNFTIAIANTIGGAASLSAHSNTTSVVTLQANVSGANNTLLFEFTPQATGTYKIQTQTISNTAMANIYSTESALTANLQITDAVSNNLSTFFVTQLANV